MYGFNNVPCTFEEIVKDNELLERVLNNIVIGARFKEFEVFYMKSKQVDNVYKIVLKDKSNIDKFNHSIVLFFANDILAQVSLIHFNTHTLEQYEKCYEILDNLNTIIWAGGDNA